jgi:hypothetical protein
MAESVYILNKRRLNYVLKIIIFIIKYYSIIINMKRKNTTDLFYQLILAFFFHNTQENVVQNGKFAKNFFSIFIYFGFDFSD